MLFRILPFSSPAILLSALLLFGATPALAQQQPTPTAQVIAIPPLATDKVTDTDAGSTWGLANQIADLITSDLKLTNSFIVADVKKVRIPSYPEVTAPAFSAWRAAGAKLLLSGFVNARQDGRLTIGCYVYDVQSGQEMARQGFAVATKEWRRAAHRCADMAYVKATGKAPIFDSRIAYIAESGAGDAVVKKLAVMDFDGASHTWLSNGESTVLTPRWSPKGNRIAFTSFSGGKLHIEIADASSGDHHPLLLSADEAFAPAFAPDGRTIAFSMSGGGNVDLFAVSPAGGYPTRLTTSPAIDTSPSYSPDGKQIVFISDRSGSSQVYVMNADGSGQHRISFGPGTYGAPVWSPDGEHIAFAIMQGPLSHVGVMTVGGSDEHIVSRGPNDGEPAWSPDGSTVLFQRVDPATRRTLLATVPMEGGAIRPVPTPQGGSDPSWVERQE